MGNKKQTILIINGRRYDALTGELVSGGETRPAVRPISDMVGGRKAAPIAQAVSTPVQEPVIVTAQATTSSKQMDVSRQSPSHTKPRHQQRSNTLVRSAVSKPRPGFKSQTKVSSPTNAVTTPAVTIAPKWPVTQVDPRRLTRAGHVEKSTIINKFAAPREPSAIEQAAIRVERPAPEPTQSELEPLTSDDLFARAIAAADSHTQQPVDQKKLARQARKQAKAAKKPVRHHLASVVAASLAVLVIGSVVGLQHKDSLTLRFAKAQAGFDASLPTYQPAGYGVGSFKYSAGSVGTTFHNASSNRDYSLSQQPTEWDSQELLDNFVSMNNQSFQTLQAGDQVIYIYGKNNASWVKDGIWYQLTSNGSLSTSQILNVAASV
jgi:hypothetical protein